MYISCFLCRFHLRRAPNANPFLGGIWALEAQRGPQYGHFFSIQPKKHVEGFGPYLGLRVAVFLGLTTQLVSNSNMFSCIYNLIEIKTRG